MNSKCRIMAKILNCPEFKSHFCCKIGRWPQSSQSPYTSLHPSILHLSAYSQHMDFDEHLLMGTTGISNPLSGLGSNPKQLQSWANGTRAASCSWMAILKRPPQGKGIFVHILEMHCPYPRAGMLVKIAFCMSEVSMLLANYISLFMGINNSCPVQNPLWMQPAHKLRLCRRN